MSAPQSSIVTTAVAGVWRVVASAPGQPHVDVTYVRGAPTTIGAWSWEDPFGPKTMTLVFPKITLFDRPGQGDLFWLGPWVDFDLIWDGPVPAGYPGGQFRWEGYAVSFDHSTGEGMTVSLVGATYQADNYLAKPGYATRPIPYEWAIAEALQDKPDLRLKQLLIEFPSWWSTTYAPVTGAAGYQIPTHVHAGDKWTGLVTRETGSWDATLTSYVQTLLSSMYTGRGRWTLDLLPGRQPVLLHRDRVVEPNATTVVIDPMTPGVVVTLSEDWTQSLSVAYGQGQSAAGTGYSGMTVTADGEETFYEPLAALRQVHPIDDRNGWLDLSVMRKEVQLQMQTGLELDEAREVGASHLAAFADPGLTGTIELHTDPRWGPGGPFLPRALLKAGMTVQLLGVFGRPEGVLLHISTATIDPAAGTASLTVDTKYRDALTVDEVRLRGRDSLSVVRQLIGGKYEPPVPDQLFPWNYAEGSGVIPSGAQYNATRLFKGIPEDILFPWQEWTTQRPPSNPSWRSCYIHLGPRSTNASNNWATLSGRHDGLALGFPIRMSQAGTIRLIEIAAYDKNGYVLRVPFHFSLYASRGVNVESMPMLAAADVVPVHTIPDDDTSPLRNPYAPYAAGQHYPFFKGAWEQYRPDGTRIVTEQPASVSSAGLIRAYGTGYLKAGFWPSNSQSGDPATGMLRDEGQFNYRTDDDDASINPYTGKRGAFAGQIYCMIYCDAQASKDVYFLGKMYRVEPGTSV